MLAYDLAHFVLPFLPIYFAQLLFCKDELGSSRLGMRMHEPGRQSGEEPCRKGDEAEAGQGEPSARSLDGNMTRCICHLWCDILVFSSSQKTILIGSVR